MVVDVFAKMFLKNVFTKMLIEAANKGAISRLLTDAIDGRIVSLQYVDDTILFLKHDPIKATHFKWL
jgi:hypothetical protein